jgi:murein DD-endopeptidase MepM/ murein hydrolase activator NlpD
MRPNPTRLLLALLVVAIALPALAVVSEDEVRRAEAEVDRILDEAQELGDQVQSAWARQAALDHEIARLEESIGHAQIQLAETEARLESVAVELYMNSASGASLSVLMAQGNGSYQAGMQYLEKVSGSDENLVDQLRIFRSEVEHQTERLTEASAEQVALASELEAMAGELQAELSSAQVFYDRLVAQREEEQRRAAEEAARRAAEEAARAATTTTRPPTTAPPTTASGGAAPPTTAAPATAVTTTATPVVSGGVCPVAGPTSFSDTWGAPRSGGRAHQGVDMIAARGTPTVAIFSGTIFRITSSSLGGLSVWLRSTSGDNYYYAHLDSYGDISVGQRVEQGHVIGYVGTTGNAPSWLPHLHFEYHPGGGGAANPYPLVRSVC